MQVAPYPLRPLLEQTMMWSCLKRRQVRKHSYESLWKPLTNNVFCRSVQRTEVFMILYVYLTALFSLHGVLFSWFCISKFDPQSSFIVNKRCTSLHSTSCDSFKAVFVEHLVEHLSIPKWTGVLICMSKNCFTIFLLYLFPWRLRPSASLTMSFSATSVQQSV